MTRTQQWLATLVGLALLLAAAVAGLAPAAARNSVGASTPTKINTVEVSTGITADQRLGKTVPQPQIVVATGVAAKSAGELSLPFKSAELRSQVGDVVKTFDETGAPPIGVEQGGLKGYPKGTYGNKNGVLPEQPLGYYTESDVWTSGNGVKRVADRLVFGNGGEVYFTPTHYDSFVQIR